MDVQRFFTLLLIGLSITRGSVAAGEVRPVAPAPPPWVQFPEVPAVLWYEEFESGANLATYGSVESVPKPADAAAPVAARGVQESQFSGAGNALTLGVLNVVGSDQKFSGGTVALAQTRLKAPGQVNPSEVAFFFLCYASDAGNIDIAFISNEGTHSVTKIVPTAKTWVPVSLRLAECRGSGGNVKPGEIFNELKFQFRPRNNKDFQKVYIDNLLLTRGVPKPIELFPVVLAASKRVKDLEKSVANDGYSYSHDKIQPLGTAFKNVKRKKKPRTVLVMAPRRGDSADFISALGKSAPKAKLNGYTFVAAPVPDHSPVGGLADMRTLLKYSLEKTECEYALLALGYGDALLPGRADQSVAVLIDRAIEAGSIPVVCVPPALNDPSINGARLAEFCKQVSGICAARGVPYIDASIVLKNTASPIKNGELSPAGLAGLAELSIKAIKHIDSNLLGRK